MADAGDVVSNDTTENWAARYWEARYQSGYNSGAGSYGHHALYKAGFLNRFVAAHRIASVGELGCGDGAQLGRARYPRYIGYDVSQTAVRMCRRIFAADETKSFVWLTAPTVLRPVDLGLSLDVIFHLLDERGSDEYLDRLFGMSMRYAIIYGNGFCRPYPAPHVRLWDFNDLIRRRYKNYTLVDARRNPSYAEIGTDPNTSWSNFYVYEATRRAWHPLLGAAKIIEPTAARPDPAMASVRAFATRASGILAVEPRGSTALPTALLENPSLPVILVEPDSADATTHMRAQVAEASPPCRDLVRVNGFAAAAARDSKTDLVILSPTALENMAPADWHDLTAAVAPDAMVIAEFPTSRAAAALDLAIARCYLREVLPEMRGASVTLVPTNSCLWFGTIQTEPSVTVSFTSSFGRVGKLVPVVDSILAQSRLPDRIIVNLTVAAPLNHPPGQPRDVPSELRALEEAGLVDVRFGDDTGTDRSLLPTLQRERDSNVVVITANDDLPYPPHWIHEIMEGYFRRPH